MLDLEQGIVVFYNARESYGFLRVLDESGRSTGEDIFFHLNQGRWVEIVGDDIEFIGAYFNKMEIYAPRVNDRLAFKRAQGGHGTVAQPWTYATAYINRAWQLFQPTYRLVRVTSHKTCHDPDIERVIWEGRGSDTMAQLFPRKKINGKWNDPLADEADEECIDHFRFYVWTLRDGAQPDPFYNNIVVDGHWRECRDPR